MPHQLWVIFNDNNSLYFIGYTDASPMWGSAGNAVPYNSEADAQAECDKIATGGIRPIHQPPNP